MTTKVPRQPIIPAPTTTRGKIGCAFGLILWFTVMMTPCVLFWFGFGNEVIIPHANVPYAHEHPLFKLGLLMTADYRGLSVTNSSIFADHDNAVCVQTNVNFLLWENRNRDNPATIYCDCYERANPETSWQLIRTDSGECATE